MVYNVNNNAENRIDKYIEREREREREERERREREKERRESD